MWTYLAVFGGLLFLAGCLIASCIMAATALDRRDEARHERAWTVAELRALGGGGPLAPVLAASAERLPFEDEYDAPARARARAQRRYEDLIIWWENQQQIQSGKATP